MANDFPASSQCIVIDDSDDEQQDHRPGPSVVKKRHNGVVQDDDNKNRAGHQSQPISIDDLASDNGQDAIDVLFGNGSEAGVVVEAAEGAVTVTNTTIIMAAQADQALPLLINILPDLDPEHGLVLLRDKILSNGQSFTIEHCLQTALESLLVEDGYPKVQKNLKRKRVVDSDDEDDLEDIGPSSASGKARISDDLLQDPTCRVFQLGKPAYKSKTFLADERQGVVYRDKSLFDLDNLFPLMATAHIRCIFSTNAKRFVPTYIALKAETLLPDDEKPYVAMKQPRAQKLIVGSTSKKGKKKAKGKSAEGAVGDGEAGFDAERGWFIDYLMNKGDGTSIDHARILVPSGEGDTECGCCFGDDEQAFMVQCAEGHNFCRECIRRMTEVAVGAQTANVVCPHTDGCDAKFHDRDLKKALPTKLYNTYCGIIQRKELEEAGIEGLESCPYCNFAIIIENQEERLFNCQSDDCGKVSCRKCGKHEHLPKTCEEAAKDNVLDHRHAIEEAMSEALIRKCPKCAQACVKEAGCNKMICQSCRTMFCNVCRATIKGYDHFDQTPANYKQPKDQKKCRLWDPVDKDPYQEEVAAAREAARKEALNRADVAAEDIDVALPEANIIPRHGAPRPPLPAGLDALYARYREAAGLIPPVGRLHPLALHHPAGPVGLPLVGRPAGPEEQVNREERLRRAMAQAEVLRDQLQRLREARNRDPGGRAVVEPGRGGEGGFAMIPEREEMLRMIQRDLANGADPRLRQPIAMDAARPQPPLAPVRIPGAPLDGGRDLQGVQGPALRLRDLMQAVQQGDGPARPVGALPVTPEGRQPPAGGAPRVGLPAAPVGPDQRQARIPVGRQRPARAVRFQEEPVAPVVPARAVRFQEDPVAPVVPARAVRFLEDPVAPVVAPDIQEAYGYAEHRRALLARIGEMEARNEPSPQDILPQALNRFAAAIAHNGLENPPARMANRAQNARQQIGEQDANQNFATLELAKQQFETTMRSIQREFPALQQAQILAAARQQAEAILPHRVRDDELAMSRRVSPRQATGIQVDPISVLLLVHERHPDWCERYYEYLTGRRPGFGLHAMFNRYAAAIIDDLREGRVVAPAIPAQRTTFHVLRQPHACWNIGATNLITLLERVMRNSGSVFPPERPVARTTVMFQNLLINACPERIILNHHRTLLEHVLHQRIVFRNGLVAPPRADVIDTRNDPVNENPAENPAAGDRPRANAYQDFDVPIPDEAPPPYEAVAAPRRAAGRAGLRAGRMPA